MDPTEVLSQFSLNRLDGEPVPDDVQILLPNRDELARRSGVRLELADDWTPWLDIGPAAEAARLDPEVMADVRARVEVCRLIAFVAADERGQFFGYWRGPTGRKVDRSPLVVLDHEGRFHLCIASTFGEAVLEKSYGREGFAELRDWLRSLGISVTWDSPNQLTFPHEKTPPRELYRQLQERYRKALMPP